MYRPPDRYLWDFWTATDAAGRTRLFHLEAPRSLGHPEERHAAARVGQAVSDDLRTWEPGPRALEVGPAGAWDDRSIWTGSVARRPDDGGWAMLYTGVSAAEGGRIQRVGLALSDDLVTWVKHPANPVIEADRSRYLGPNPDHHGELAWRDPCLVADPAGGWLALITAQARDGVSRGGGPRGCGCLALARSTDLVRWTVGPPALHPGWAFHLEIPQVVETAPGRWLLLVNAEAGWIRAGAPVSAQTGTLAFTGPSPAGPFTLAGRLTGAPTSARYGLKLVPDPAGGGRWKALNWRGWQPDNTFAGTLDDPVPVTLDAAGVPRLG